MAKIGFSNLRGHPSKAETGTPKRSRSPMTIFIAASPLGETACIRRTGICAKRNTPKKGRKFKHLEPPSGKAEKSVGRSPSRRPRIALYLADDDVARPFGRIWRSGCAADFPSADLSDYNIVPNVRGSHE
jgi:hypothetical protein